MVKRRIRRRTTFSTGRTVHGGVGTEQSIRQCGTADASDKGQAPGPFRSSGTITVRSPGGRSALGAAEGRTSTPPAGSTIVGASGGRSLIRATERLGGCVRVVSYKNILCCRGRCCCARLSSGRLVGLCHRGISCRLGGRSDLHKCGSLCSYLMASPRVRYDRPRSRPVCTPLRGKVLSLVR